MNNKTLQCFNKAFFFPCPYMQKIKVEKKYIREKMTRCAFFGIISRLV